MVKKFITGWKKKWNISTDRDFWLIMLVFSLAGMMVTQVRKPVFLHLGITAETAFWIKAVIYIPLIVPVYQISLLFFALLLGQFNFFWTKQKTIGRRIFSLFSRPSSPQNT